MSEKDQWLLAAERFDAFRLIPRFMLALYFGFFMKAWFFVVSWFIAFDWNSLPSDPVVGTVVVGAIAGFPALILGILTKVFGQLMSTLGASHPERKSHED